MFRNRLNSSWRARSGGVLQSELRLLVVGISLATILGCGASARKDFDLNKGEAAEDSAAAEVFSWDDWLGAPADSNATTWSYTVGEGDRLEITFFSHPEQNRFVIVRPDGMISLPYVGELRVSGRSATAIGAELREKYAQVLIDPVIDVIVHETGATFYVLGEVNVPGEFDYTRRVTLLQAVARAGGYSDEARLSSLVLMRKLEDGRSVAAVLNFREYMQLAERRGDIALRPFDIVWVPQDNITRIDNFAKKLFSNTILAEDVVIKSWSLANFNEVFKGRLLTP